MTPRGYSEDAHNHEARTGQASAPGLHVSNVTLSPGNSSRNHLPLSKSVLESPVRREGRLSESPEGTLVTQIVRTDIADPRWLTRD